MSDLQTYGRCSQNPDAAVKEKIQELVENAARELHTDTKVPTEQVLESVRSWFPVVEKVAVQIAMNKQGQGHMDQKSYLDALDDLSSGGCLPKDYLAALNRHAAKVLDHKLLGKVPPIVNCVARQMRLFVLHCLAQPQNQVVDAKAS